MPRRHNKIPSVSCNRADFGWVRTRNSTITGGICSDRHINAEKVSLESGNVEKFHVNREKSGEYPLMFIIICAILYSV